MRTDEFDYQLPSSLIAQRPLAERDACRLLTLDRATGALTHGKFRDLIGRVRPGDRFVFNDTRVLPARLFCAPERGAGGVELLLIEPADDRTWTALVKPGRRAKAGAVLFVNGSSDNGILDVVEVMPDGKRLVRLREGSASSSMTVLLERFGHMPLPPYVKRPDDFSDQEQYQTVYARRSGAIAAPTAGLHFTEDILGALRAEGADITFVTLHVGMGTFLPVKVDDPADHVMHEERYELSPAAAAGITATRRCGGRIIAVGTTVVRILEHCALAPTGTSSGVDQHFELLPSSGATRLKILPPWNFQVVDGLVTNFHLPKSTLLMLVSAFAGVAGRDAVMAAYAEAVRERYRFFSYGDAMLIL
ncbi:MAG: tRNA preQ1(34) S-adenosylmethionine ribosyltransferase-isomerase QueA [Chitinispirillaceae bacterium]|jgi:S-adenosylmethionine:tRNA ribosyltransferase-isomerase|nr:tRNA preQ1(34) S-adenosylmethionine ribosyltransferase-isomerase QueA [Chitinispirillaceae bacterium]